MRDDDLVINSSHYQNTGNSIAKDVINQGATMGCYSSEAINDW